MYKTLQPVLQKELEEIENAGLFKRERIIITPQGADIKVSGGAEVINFCANNYLGLSSHPKVIEAAKKAIDVHGYGMSSVRFICGTPRYAIRKCCTNKTKGLADWIPYFDAKYCPQGPDRCSQVVARSSGLCHVFP